MSGAIRSEGSEPAETSRCQLNPGPPVVENVREMANCRQDGWTLVRFIAKMSAPEMDITFGAYSSDG